MRRNKWNARKIDIDGYTFDSLAEGRRYEELKLLVSAGEIERLTIHPHFELFPKIKFGNKTLRAIGYTADFMYYENGNAIVEDVKGVMTRDASLRINLFQRQYTGMDVRIIKKR